MRYFCLFIWFYAGALVCFGSWFGRHFRYYSVACDFMGTKFIGKRIKSSSFKKEEKIQKKKQANGLSVMGDSYILIRKRNVYHVSSWVKKMENWRKWKVSLMFFHFRQNLNIFLYSLLYSFCFFCLSVCILREYEKFSYLHIIIRASCLLLMWIRIRKAGNWRKRNKMPTIYS